jgi:hypothetical protein
MGMDSVGFCLLSDGSAFFRCRCGICSGLLELLYQFSSSVDRSERAIWRW